MALFTSLPKHWEQKTVKENENREYEQVAN
jgi:hypothetical protein